MAEVKKEVIIDADGENKLLSVVESSEDPWVFGIVLLNSDWSDI